MYCGKKIAVTFSYDDGVTQDIRLIELFNKYGLIVEPTKLMWIEVIKLIYRKSPLLNQVYPEWLNDFINEVQKPQNIRRKVSELTELTHFSHRHLTRLFLQYTGQTLNEYLLIARMNYAAMLLRTTQQDILQISAAVGYDSLSHFIRIFKGHFKITPKQYRMTFHYQEEE